MNEGVSTFDELGDHTDSNYMEDEDLEVLNHSPELRRIYKHLAKDDLEPKGYTKI